MREVSIVMASQLPMYRGQRALGSPGVPKLIFLTPFGLFESIPLLVDGGIDFGET